MNEIPGEYKGMRYSCYQFGCKIERVVGEQELLATRRDALLVAVGETSDLTVIEDVRKRAAKIQTQINELEVEKGKIIPCTSCIYR